MKSAQPLKHLYPGLVLSALLFLLMTATASAQDEGAASGATDSNAPAASTSEGAAPEAKPKKVSYSNKWRLEFSGGAESEGVITLKFIPKEGEAIQADTPIKKGTGENSVAAAVVKSLKAQLPKKVYHIERDDGEDVLVKKKYKAQDFGIEIVGNTVKGVRINREKE